MSFGPPPTVDVVILAAGRSTRMGGPNKLLATFGGVPLIRRSAATALASRARRVRVVVGHQAEAMRASLAGLAVEIVVNPAFGEGLSTSVIAGCEAAFGDGADGVLIMLADQPMLTAADLDRLLDAFVPEGLGSLVAAMDTARLANPVVLSSRFRGAIRDLTGDSGAKRLLTAHPDCLRTVELGAGAGTDVDTPEAMAAAGGRLTT